MTARRRAWVGVSAVAACFAGACLHDAGPARTPAAQPTAPVGPQASTEAPIVINSTIVYTRPRLFESVARPRSIGFVRDYRTASAGDVTILTGAWNEATQTLSADVTITLRSENLVFVDDPVIGPGSETPIRAGRSGELHEVACPEIVPAQQPCYLLQVLR